MSMGLTSVMVYHVPEMLLYARVFVFTLITGGKNVAAKNIVILQRLRLGKDVPGWNAQWVRNATQRHARMGDAVRRKSVLKLVIIRSHYVTGLNAHLISNVLVAIATNKNVQAPLFVLGILGD